MTDQPDSVWAPREPKKLWRNPDGSYVPVTEEELQQRIAAQVAPGHLDNRGMDPALGGARENQQGVAW